MQVSVPTGLDSRLRGNDGGGFGGVGGFGGLKPALVYRNFRIIATNRPGRHPRPPKADNRCVAQGAAGQPIGTTGQLPTVYGCRGSDTF